MDNGDIFDNRQCGGYKKEGNFGYISGNIFSFRFGSTFYRTNFWKWDKPCSELDCRVRGGGGTCRCGETHAGGDRLWRCIDGGCTWRLAGLPGVDRNFISCASFVSSIFCMADFCKEHGKEVQNCISAVFGGRIFDLVIVGREGEKRMKLKGSYTVEAALLMALVIPLLAGIIYMGFYLHNGAAMQNAAYELAALGSLHYGEKEREEIIKERKREIGSQLFLGIQGIEAEIHIGKKKITADFQGNLQVPGLVMRIFCGNRLEVRGHAELISPQPQKTVMRIHLLKKIGEVKDGSNVSPRQ